MLADSWVCGFIWRRRGQGWRFIYELHAHASHKKTQDCLRESVESLRWHLEVQDPQLGNHRTGPYEQRTVILGEGSGQ